MNCITKNERKNTMKNNTTTWWQEQIKPTLNEKEIYVRLHDNQKAFIRMTNRYGEKGTISHNVGYMSVGRDLLGQFASLKKAN